LPHQLTFQHDEAIRRFLLERQARGDRDERGMAATVRRLLRRYDAVVRRSDPVASGELPAALVPAFLGLVRAPWRLSPFEIGLLDRVVADDPRLGRCAEEHGVAPAALVEALGRLTYAQRLALVDHAERVHAGRKET
jgi:hypothetical protein